MKSDNKLDKPTISCKLRLWVMFTYKRKFSLTVNATSLLTSLVNSRLYWFQAAVTVGISWCATLLDDCTCRLKLLNQDSSCRLKNLSTESDTQMNMFVYEI